MLGLDAKSTSNKRHGPGEGTVGTASSESLLQKENLLVVKKNLSWMLSKRKWEREMSKRALKNARNES